MKNPDMNQIAARVVQQATHGEFVPAQERQKNRAAVSLGRRGGKVGGPARAAALSAKQRSAIASKGADTRWGPSVEHGGEKFYLGTVVNLIFEDYVPAKVEMHPSPPSEVKPGKTLIVEFRNKPSRQFYGQEAVELNAAFRKAGWVKHD